MAIEMTNTIGGEELSQRGQTRVFNIIFIMANKDGRKISKASIKKVQRKQGKIKVEKQIKIQIFFFIEIVTLGLLINLAIRVSSSLSSSIMRGF